MSTEAPATKGQTSRVYRLESIQAVCRARPLFAAILTPIVLSIGLPGLLWAAGIGMALGWLVPGFVDENLEASRS